MAAIIWCVNAAINSAMFVRVLGVMFTIIANMKMQKMRRDKVKCVED